MRRFNIRFFDAKGEECEELQRLDVDPDVLGKALIWFAKQEIRATRQSGNLRIWKITLMEVESFERAEDKAEG